MAHKNLGEFDYVIIGGGTAGCVLANRLSADPSVTVALIEAGGNDNWIWFHIPVGYLYCIGNPRADWGYRTEPSAGLNGRSLIYPRGKVLGGCSAINGMIYMRGQARDYDHWRQLGNPGWSWDDVLPLFRASEDQAALSGPALDAAIHGTGGEWRVEKQRLSWAILDAFKAAAEHYGLRHTDDFNSGDNAGIGYFHVNQRSGWRVSTAKAFLKPILRRPNLTVFTKAHTQRVELTDKRASAVIVRRDGEDGRLTARGEVILAAGALGSPQILQLSGIGPGGVAQDFGIALQHELRGVGENLQDHLQVRCAYKVSGVSTLNQRASSLLGKLSIGLEYLLFRSGPMSMAPSQMGAFLKSDPALETPDLEFHVQPLTLEAFGQPLHAFPAFTASICNLRPESRGYVRLKSPDSFAAPAIQPNYLATEGDRAVAARAIRITREIIARPPLARYKPEEFKPGPAYGETDADLARAAGDIASTIFHPVGTCKMGDSFAADPMAVVDARLRVHGLRGLRVVDASIMPTITSGNTNSPVIMIAEKAARMIAEDRRATG